MIRKRTLTFYKEEHYIENSNWRYTVVKDSYIMSTAMKISKEMKINICNVHFSDWKKCSISAKAEKDIWLLFCYKLIEALEGHIERYSF